MLPQEREQRFSKQRQKAEMSHVEKKIVVLLQKGIFSIKNIILLLLLLLLLTTRAVNKLNYSKFHN